MNTASRSFRLIEIGILGVVIIGLGLVLVPSLLRAARRMNRSVSCSSSLRSLWQCQYNYAAHYGRTHDHMVEALGSDFFLALQRTPKPLIDRFEPFFCPLVDDDIVPGRTSYRGPAFPIRKMDDKDPVAADKEGNHGPGEGGSILTRTGDVSEYTENDALWIRARTTTRE